MFKHFSFMTLFQTKILGKMILLSGVCAATKHKRLPQQLSEMCTLVMQTPQWTSGSETQSDSDLAPLSQEATPCSWSMLPAGGWSDSPTDTQRVMWSLSVQANLWDFHLQAFSICTKFFDLYSENWGRTSQPFQCKQLSVELPNSFIPLQLPVSPHS